MQMLRVALAATGLVLAALVATPEVASASGDTTEINVSGDAFTLDGTSGGELVRVLEPRCDAVSCRVGVELSDHEPGTVKVGPGCEQNKGRVFCQTTSLHPTMEIYLRGRADIFESRASASHLSLVTVDGGPGSDELGDTVYPTVYRGGSGPDYIEPDFWGREGIEAGPDDVSGGSGIDWVTYGHATRFEKGVPPGSVTISLDDVANDAGATPSDIDNVRSDIEHVLTGHGNDTLIGSDRAEWFESGSGRDVIIAGGGDDIIDGGKRDDVVDAGPGNDYVFGSDGNDILNGAEGDDVVVGGPDDDTIDGGPGIDTISGDKPTSTPVAGDDVILGRDGEPDIVDCGAGTDRAEVDFIDQIARASQRRCERLDVAPVPAGWVAPAIGKRFKATTSHTARVGVSCRKEAVRCEATLTLTQDGGTSPVLARGLVTLSPGDRGYTEVALTKRGLALVRSGKSTKATLTVRVGDRLRTKQALLVG